MIIDFRYHVASLVAIFIALALGILIGSTLVGEDFMENLAREQQIWIGKLENDYLNLKKETENLRIELVKKQNELNYYYNFVAEVKPFLINNKLQGKKFAIIEIEQNGPSQDVANILEQSGAIIVSSTRLKFYDWMRERFTSSMLSEHISNLILNGETNKMTSILEENDIIRSIGKYGEELDGIIIINGYHSQEKLLIEAENSIINLLKSQIPLYVIESMEPGSLKIIKEQVESGVCRIPNLQNIPGQIALILSILENTKRSK